MKFRLLAGALLLLVIMESCQRSFTPFQAANAPRGKKCGVIR